MKYKVKIYFNKLADGTTPKPMEFECEDITHMLSGMVCFTDSNCKFAGENSDLYLPSSNINIMIGNTSKRYSRKKHAS